VFRPRRAPAPPSALSHPPSSLCSARRVAFEVRRPPGDAKRPSRQPRVSSYAPGSGHIEEEVIEEEEFDAPPIITRKADEHDLEDFEEETLPTQMRTGDLGECCRKPTSTTASS
jgi:hypothetical protein